MEKYEMQDYLKNQLGIEEAYNEIINALSTDQLQDLFDYIVRVHDIEPNYKNYENDEDDEDDEDDKETEEEQDKNINVIVIENNNDLIKMITKRTIKDNLHEFYNIINCDLIDIIERKINGKYYNIICDEEFLLKEQPRITLIEKNHQEILCGNLIICPIDEEHTEQLGSFTEEEQHEIFNYLMSHIDYEF